MSSPATDAGWRPAVGDGLRNLVQGYPAAAATAASTTTSARLAVSAASGSAVPVPTGFTVSPKMQAGFVPPDIVRPVMLTAPSILTSGTSPLPFFAQASESAWRPGYSDPNLQTQASKIHIPEKVVLQAPVPKQMDSHRTAAAVNGRVENSALQNLSSNTTTTTTNGSQSSFFGGKRSINGWLKQNWGKVTVIVIMLLVTTIFVVRLVFIARNKKKQQAIAGKAKLGKNPEWETFFQTDNKNAQPQPSSLLPVPGRPGGPVPAMSGGGFNAQTLAQYPFLNTVNRNNPNQPSYQPQPQHTPPPAPRPLQPHVNFQSSANPNANQQSSADLSGLTALPPLNATPLPQPQPQHRSTPQSEPSANATHQGGRGMQQRFAPPETMHAGVSMPASMMPESTRPIRESSSDGTFTVSAGDIPVVVTQESDAPITRTATASGSTPVSVPVSVSVPLPVSQHNSGVKNNSLDVNVIHEQQDTS